MSDQSLAKGRVSRLAVSGWPLRRKVALALAIPLLLAAAFGGLRVTNDLEKSTNSAASAQQVTVLEPAIGYIIAAEKGMVAAQNSVGSSQAELDDALIEIKAAADELVKTRDSANLTFEQRRQVDVILDLSRALRDEATGPVSPGTWIAQLRQMQSGVTKLILTIISEQLNPEPRLELLSQALSGRFALAQQQALIASGRTGRTVELALFAEFGAESVALDRLAGQRGVADSSIQTLRINNAGRASDAGTGRAALGSADAYGEYDNMQGALIDAVDKELATTAADARSSALLDALLTLAALAAAVALALLISRAIVNPIRRVREGALRVAQFDLPDAVNRIRAGAEPGPITPIDVSTHEEVGQLARAVDDLHRQAVTLASGEATVRSQVGEMFVTLSRRNTTLINQQLNLIETLERDEEDPKRLESLFRLDHLAARMRRTSDSLLILADAPTRSAGWESVSIGEALQAATAGVADYKRVRSESSLAILVNESAAGDLVHLLTEIVDNSLSYSSPHTSVVLASAETPNGVTITVADTGLGIPADELEQLNDNLRDGVEVTPDTARRMGLFVVSRLAQRHGISVQLKHNRGDGTTAYVLVPNAILPERAHLEPVPVEDTDEAAEAAMDAQNEAPETEFAQSEAVEVEARATADAIIGSSKDSDGQGDRDEAEDTDVVGDSTHEAPTPIAVRRSAEPSFDESDPLGIGDSHLHQQEPQPRPSEGLPTRERGATLSHLSAAGVQLPKLDADGNQEPEVPRELKRATGAMAFRSKRDLEAGRPTVTAVPDLPADDVEETEGDSLTESLPSQASAPILGLAETFATRSALDEPAVHDEEVIDEEVIDEEVLVDAVPNEVEAETGADAEAEPEPDVDESPEAHIAALLAKIRPQRGRLPIPDYDEVDHAEILRTPVRGRGSLDGGRQVDPLSDPLSVSSYDGSKPVEPALASWAQVTTAAPAANRSSEPVFDTETAPSYAQPTHSAARSADLVEPAVAARRDEQSATNGASRSSWLSTVDEDRTWSSTEVEAGWKRADTVAATHETTNDVGLPVRRPGARLVPGSVTKPIGAAGRDPEAIRARLSAHKAGVRRGRTASVTADQQ